MLFVLTLSYVKKTVVYIFSFNPQLTVILIINTMVHCYKGQRQPLDMLCVAPLHISYACNVYVMCVLLVTAATMFDIA